jgi:hypothetical protein
MVGLILVLLLAAPAVASQYAFDPGPSPFNHYVPGNLMSLARAAEDHRLERFAKRLDCWAGGDAMTGEILCDDGEDEVSYKWIRQEDYRRESILLIVPADYQ